MNISSISENDSSESKSSESKSSESINNDLMCPITMDWLEDPITLQCCENTFSRQSILDHINSRINATCPKCRKQLDKNNILSLSKSVVIANLVEEKQKNLGIKIKKFVPNPNQIYSTVYHDSPIPNQMINPIDHDSINQNNIPEYHITIHNTVPNNVSTRYKNSKHSFIIILCILICNISTLITIPYYFHYYMNVSYGIHNIDILQDKLNQSNQNITAYVQNSNTLCYRYNSIYIDNVEYTKFTCSMKTTSVLTIICLICFGMIFAGLFHTYCEKNTQKMKINNIKINVFSVYISIISSSLFISLIIAIVMWSSLNNGNVRIFMNVITTTMIIITVLYGINLIISYKYNSDFDTRGEVCCLSTTMSFTFYFTLFAFCCCKKN